MNFFDQNPLSYTNMTPVCSAHMSQNSFTISPVASVRNNQFSITEYDTPVTPVSHFTPIPSVNEFVRTVTEMASTNFVVYNNQTYEKQSLINPPENNSPNFIQWRRQIIKVFGNFLMIS